MIAFAALTDVGRRRSLNEDFIHASDDLFVVCDGMGGHKAGEVASKLAVEAISGFIRRSGEDPEMTWPYGYDPKLPYDANRLSTAIKLANRVVSRKGGSADEYTGMGTTVVAVLASAQRPRVTYANVGDSRIYMVRAGVMLQLTRDDTWANLGWPEGADPDHPAMPMKNVLTKALGAREELEFDVGGQTLQEGDVVVLCSDGLTNMLSDDAIAEVVRRRSKDLEAACQELVARANAEGGRDNISVILLQYRS